MIRAQVLSFLGPDDWLRAWRAGFVPIEAFYDMAHADPNDAYGFVCNIKAWMFMLPDGAFADAFRQAVRFVPLQGTSWSRPDQLVWDFDSVSLLGTFVERLGPVSRMLRVAVASETDLVRLVDLTQTGLNVVAVCVVHKDPWPGKIKLADAGIRLRELWLSYPLKDTRGLKQMTGTKHFNRYWPLMSAAVDRWVV
jgi:hypothetical protein